MGEYDAEEMLGDYVQWWSETGCREEYERWAGIIDKEIDMRAGDMIESKYLKQADLKGEEVIVTVQKLGQGNVAMDDKPEEIKWMVKFTEFNKAMVLNSTNIRTLERLLGEETDLWIGKEVVLYVDENVSFGGELVGGLRLKSAKPATAPKRFTNPAAKAAMDEKDIPFN